MADTQVKQPLTPTCMESVNRITKLPVVESTYQTASNLYEKVKEYNSVTQWTCSTAECAVTKAVEVGRPIAAPIVQGLEGPIKKVDGVLCTGLDYVESKVPAVKLPPGEMYTTTKDYVSKTVTPVYENAHSYVQKTYERVEPAVQAAKNSVEPVVGRAKHMVDPYVQPALDRAEALKNYGSQKLGEILRCGHSHPEGNPECDECKAVAKKMSEEKNKKE